jgi:hypothetical protein
MKYVVKNIGCSEIYDDKFYECDHEYELYAHLLTLGDFDCFENIAHEFPDTDKFNCKNHDWLQYIKQNIRCAKRLYSSGECIQDDFRVHEWVTFQVSEYKEPVFRNLSI